MLSVGAKMKDDETMKPPARESSATEALNSNGKRAVSTGAFPKEFETKSCSLLEMMKSKKSGGANTDDDDHNTTTKSVSVFDNMQQDLNESLFPSIRWPTSDNNDQEDDEHHDDDDRTQPGGGDREDSFDRDEFRPKKRSRPALRRVAQCFRDLTDVDKVSQTLFDNCTVVPDEYTVLSEYTQPIVLTLLFRLFQSDTTPFAYRWCAAFACGHTIYCMATDFSHKQNGVALATTKSWAMLDFLSHQVVDSLSVHALVTTMLLYPTMFGSNAFLLALFLILTQPLHLSIWFKSNFGPGASTSQDEHETRWIILFTIFAFCAPSILLLVSSSLHHQGKWQTVQSVCFWAGIGGFNAAPVYTLMHAYKHQHNATLAPTDSRNSDGRGQLQ